jgi:alanine dehydrogenase
LHGFVDIIIPYMNQLCERRKLELFIKSVGLPRMHKETGEKRDFLPDLVRELSSYPVDVVIEEGYGKAMGIAPKAYLKANPKARYGKMAETYKQDLVIVLRAPETEQIELMKEGSVLLSMLHYETRPLRIKKLKEKNITALSLDSIMDDEKHRLVENLAGTSWNGTKVAFEELAKSMPDFFSKYRSLIAVSIIGTGAVGMHAARASSKYGNVDLYKTMEEGEIPGVLVQFISRSISRDRNALAYLLKTTDILVDASKRYDPTSAIVSNELVGLLPEHAIILDLTADPYNFDITPIQVKGIEGIPTGNLDQYVFYPNDSIYNRLSRYVNTTNRRTVVSCSAWPGITPTECMEIYGRQISRFFPVLFSKSPIDLNIDSNDFSERALARSTIEYFEKHILPCYV